MCITLWNTAQSSKFSMPHKLHATIVLRVVVQKTKLVTGGQAVVTAESLIVIWFVYLKGWGRWPRDHLCSGFGNSICPVKS